MEICNAILCLLRISFQLRRLRHDRNSHDETDVIYSPTLKNYCNKKDEVRHSIASLPIEGL
jgi:hypothetical protein